MKCPSSWGVFGTSSLFEVPVLKRESFNFCMGESNRPLKFKQWKDRPFKVSQLSEWLALERDLKKAEEEGSEYDNGKSTNYMYKYLKYLQSIQK